LSPPRSPFPFHDSRFKVKGFLFSGISAGIKKERKKDLALIYSEVPAQVAGLFTTNRVKAAPVLIDQKRIRQGLCQAVLINSGNANACTGPQGLADCYTLSSFLSKELKIPPKHIFLASTGVIGNPLPIEKIIKKIPRLVRNLSPDGWRDVVEAMMTTDTYPKMAWATCKIKGQRVKLCGMVKGAGMIRPNLATMLSFLVTDGNIEATLLQKMLKEASEHSFNRITIDGEMSTNDTVLLLANGKAGHPVLGHRDRDVKTFNSMLMDVCQRLAQSLVRDGEGATKLIEVVVRGARTQEDGKKAAYAIAHSPLVKTAFFGEDANWGRILCALGHSGVSINPNRVDIFFDKAPIVRNGMGVGPPLEKKAEKVIQRNSFKVVVDLHQGKGEFSILTTDLSIDYVKINASYRS
jgi:glutamate N-acetyltransferase/amino-acid N-acetyltransferase